MRNKYWSKFSYKQIKALYFLVGEMSIKILETAGQGQREKNIALQASMDQGTSKIPKRLWF